MPLKIKKTVKQMVDEANGQIETLPLAEAIKLVGQPGVTFIDIRDPRELWRDGTIPGAINVTRGMLEMWIDPGEPLCQGLFPDRQQVRLLLRRRLALGAGDQDGAGHGPDAGRPFRGRLRRLEEGGRAGRKVEPKK